MHESLKGLEWHEGMMTDFSFLVENPNPLNCEQNKKNCNVLQSKQSPLDGFTWPACSQCAILEFLFYAAFGILNIQCLLSKHTPQVSRSNPHNTLVPGFDIFTDKQKALFFLF